jgi:RNA-binding protein YlmH
MSLYNEQELPFVKRIKSIKEDALYNYKFHLTRFLNMREQEIIKEIIGSDLFLYESSILEYGEYKRMVISPMEIKPDFKITLLNLIYPKKYLKLHHRKVLGAILSLSIERNLIGDIFFTKDDDCYIFASSEIKDFLIDNLRLISHQPVELVETSTIKGEIKIELEYIDGFVKSLRLDSVVALLFKIGRNEAQELIQEGMCKVNQKEIQNTTHHVQEGDIISLKGYGKGKIIEIGGLSKSERIFLKLGKFI